MREKREQRTGPNLHVVGLVGRLGNDVVQEGTQAVHWVPRSHLRDPVPLFIIAATLLTPHRHKQRHKPSLAIRHNNRHNQRHNQRQKPSLAIVRAPL